MSLLKLSASFVGNADTRIIMIVPHFLDLIDSSHMETLRLDNWNCRPWMGIALSPILFDETSALPSSLLSRVILCNYWPLSRMGLSYYSSTIRSFSSSCNSNHSCLPRYRSCCFLSSPAHRIRWKMDRIAL